VVRRKVKRFTCLTQLALIASTAILLVACNTGSYPLDVFPEMHYQPSHRPLEPERLTPPDGAVPVTGAAPSLTYAQARDLPNPVPRSSASRERARQTYLVNCATCHGVAGDGQGPMAPYYSRSPAGVVPPADLASPRVQSRTDGQLWWIIGQGLGNMPPYGDLLDDEQIWLTVLFIREAQGR
jgi:mono/diheme cytochrome c family protein